MKNEGLWILLAKQHQLRAELYATRIASKAYLNRLGKVFKGGLPEHGGTPLSEEEILQDEIATMSIHIDNAQKAIDNIIEKEETRSENWDNFRNKWALKAPMPSEETIMVYIKNDRALNPHNDSYKPPLRSKDEIISDLSFIFADKALSQQFGRPYTRWLEENTVYNNNTGARSKKSF